MMDKVGPVILPRVEGKVKAVVHDIIHERGRGAPIAKLKIDGDGKVRNELIIATEGLYTGQVIEIGDEVPLTIGNCMKLRNMPEGSSICSVERKCFDGGRIARSSGCHATIVGYNRDTNLCTIKLPSGVKKTVSGDARAMIGMISGSGRVEKPLLKAGRAYFKYKARGIHWPKVRGVAMNPVDHPHGGGNHQHIGHPSTISKHAPPNARVGLVGARRTGRRKGSRKIFNK
ncbi:60S ribosomal protein L8-like [Nylanderia fulva]|uniref:60S ribosomal protein L8-like n=1 Tax=Nylanderia fulva TaxID=613905 RepID=UPI0010FB362C|nr:60S ribosomal protein L8-like [Nylanderia fulva]